MEISPSEPTLNFCQACAVRNRAICADLDPGELQALNSIGRRRKVEAGEQLLWEGGDANAFEGLLKLSTQTAEGKEQILGLTYPSDFLGRPFGEKTSCGVEALTPALVCKFQRTDFDRFACEHPRLEHKLFERTLSELDRTRRWMFLLGRMNAEQSSELPAGDGEPIGAEHVRRGYRQSWPFGIAAFAPADRSEQALFLLEAIFVAQVLVTLARYVL